VVTSQLLIQFLFRLTFGVALAMTVTPHRWVSAGFYRVHLWVLIGVNTVAALALYTQRDTLRELLTNWNVVFLLSLALIILSYAGSVIWLYEKEQLGGVLLFVIALIGLLAAVFATRWPAAMSGAGVFLALLDLGSSGVLLGVTLAALFLGHWYLNTPTMELLPLKQLVIYLIAAIVARTLVSGMGLLLQAGAAQPLEPIFWAFIGFRWLAGLLGTSMLALLVWYTLKVPNTQSATGILYAGVVLTFLGELTSQLLSVDALYPL
jgi:hypothetical protein